MNVDIILISLCRYMTGKLPIQRKKQKINQSIMSFLGKFVCLFPVALRPVAFVLASHIVSYNMQRVPMTYSDPNPHGDVENITKPLKELLYNLDVNYF